ncbi:hypothetical protein [Leisingera sp. ANG-S5]|uniref:hypothetical protein n=1 Tax=Leisingera sp. ANG-S5 TaxID=1577901 RepID=UPI00187C110E|nr:hypothetical protein [Leisingera sp. ANG-S5]
MKNLVFVLMFGIAMAASAPAPVEAGPIWEFIRMIFSPTSTGCDSDHSDVAWC